MKVILFGASGMVGQGVLRECLLDPAVEYVLSIGRHRLGASDPKLHEIVQQDLWHYSNIESQLAGFDACFFCLGISSAGLKQEEYEHITFGITLAAGETLSRLNPQMTFIYISGAGTDSTERGRLAWARIKGHTENALLALPFKAAYMFRPGFIQPLHGIQSRTPMYRFLYVIFGPLVPLLRRIAPNAILTTEQIGRAMINVAQHGFPKRILEVSDIASASLT